MDKGTDESSIAKRKLAKDIIGEIVLSDSPDAVIKKWRGIFKISQKRLAKKLGITSSVISDYESGRRASPGIKVVRKYVDALISIDEDRGENVIKSFSKITNQEPVSDAIIDIREFEEPIGIKDFCSAINASVLVGNKDTKIYGYTVIDSLKAITEFSFQELGTLYGSTTQRALIFTKIERGRTPVVAIKLTNLQPGLVVLHGLDRVDDVAKRIAELEGIPLAVCKINTVDKIVEDLKKIRK